MFHGSIPSDMQSIVGEHVKGWDCSDVFVGCSGNFTVERVLCGVTGHRLHSNDVTLFSAVIGRFLCGEPLAVALNPDFEEVAWLREYLRSPEDTVATVLLGSRLVQLLGKQNDYYARMLKAYQEQWPILHEKTRERLLASPLRLASFVAADVGTWIDDLPRDQGFICYPPFFGAAKAYARDFARLEQVFVWDGPTYEMLDEERLAVLFAKVREFRFWLFGSNELLPEFQQYWRGMTKTTNRGVPIYVYAGGGPTRIVRPAQEIEPVLVPRLLQGGEIGKKMALAILSNGQFSSLRSLYMNENIRPGQATLAVGVLVDGVLVGVFAFSAAPNLVSWDAHIEGPTIYLLSDFPVAPSSYPRLSKLVLYAALSQESKMLAERVARKRIRSCVTTAFSQRPVSMKYRGLFDLLTRAENDAREQSWAADIDPVNAYYNQAYKLNYGAMMGEWDLAKGLELWKKKHGKFVEVSGG